MFLPRLNCRISRLYAFSKRPHYGLRQGASHSRLAWTPKDQRHPVLPGLRQFLPAFHSKILRNHCSTNPAHSLRYCLGLLQKMPLRFHITKASLHHHADLGSLDSRHATYCQNGCFQLCPRCYPFHHFSDWRWNSPNCFSFLDFYPTRAQLQHPQQRIARNIWSIQNVGIITLRDHQPQLTWLRIIKILSTFLPLNYSPANKSDGLNSSANLTSLSNSVPDTLVPNLTLLLDNRMSILKRGEVIMPA